MYYLWVIQIYLVCTNICTASSLGKCRICILSSIISTGLCHTDADGAREIHFAIGVEKEMDGSARVVVKRSISARRVALIQYLSLQRWTDVAICLAAKLTSSRSSVVVVRCLFLTWRIMRLNYLLVCMRYCVLDRRLLAIDE